MSDQITISRHEWANLTERLRELAATNDSLRDTLDLIARLDAAPDAVPVAVTLARLLNACLGGGHVIVYHQIGDAIHWVDGAAENEQLTAVDDAMVRSAFEGGGAGESGTVPASPMAPVDGKSSWVIPLVAGEQVIAVLKGETMPASAGETHNRLTPFLQHAARALKTAAEMAVLKRAEELLWRQTHLTDALFNQAISCFVIFDLNWRFIRVNEAYTRHYHKRPEEVVGRLYADVIPNDDQAKAELIRKLIIEQKQPVIISEGLYVFPDQPERGNTYWDIVLQPLFDGQGEVEFIFFSSIDVTERHKAQQALRDSAAEILNLYNTQRRLNRELQATSSCNQALLRATDEQSLLTTICSIVCDKAGYRMASVAFAQHDAARTLLPVAYAGPDSGALVTPESSWSDDGSQDGGPAAAAVRTGESVYFQDITTDERMRPWREDAQRHGYRSGIALPLKDDRNRTFGVFLMCAAEPNAITDAEVRLLEELAGDLAFGITTLRLRNERNRTEEALRRLNEELEDRVRERTADLQAAGDELTQNQLALIKLVDDLNDKTHSLEAMNRRLESVNLELEAFSYSVSHDLRAPLRSIDGFSRILFEDHGERLDADGRDCLATIRAAAKRMGQLIDDLLNLSWVTRNDLQVGAVDLSHLASEITSELARREPERHVTVAIAPTVAVQGDARLLRVALENLLGNAWKFTSRRPDPRIEFGVGERGGEPVYFVQDNGAGFDMAHVQRLFTPFQRLHTTEEFPGTGIGLATVQRVINRHGGRIWAESTEGSGATFLFTLSDSPTVPHALR